MSIAFALLADAIVSKMEIDEVTEWRKVRLKALADNFGGNAPLGRALGFKDGAYIGQMISGHRPITEKTVAAVSALPGLKRWFDPTSGEPSNVALAPMGGARIPLISSVQAGVWTEVVDNFSPGDAQDWLMTDQRLSKRAFALEIKGLSMLPEFKPGDRVIIDPDVAPQPGDFVVAKNGEDEATFKKYRPRGSDASGNAIFELVPLNEDFESIRSDAQPIRVIGTMVEHRKYRNRDQK